MTKARKAQTAQAKRQRVALAPRQAFATLDSTATTETNALYYANATGGPADVTLDRSTREIAQHRCESEFLNEVTLYGACLKSSALAVGVGPALKIQGPRLGYQQVPPEHLRDKCQYLEQVWEDFAKDIRLRKLLQLLPMELIYHGEILLRRVPCDRFREGFDYVPIRPERLGNPFDFIGDPCVYDGIRFDRADDGGKPTAYYILREYINPVHVTYEYEEVPADQIIHVFSPMLPQQHRGCPSVQSGLPRLAQLRTLIKATLNAAINAARNAVFLHTDNHELLESLADIDDPNGDPAFKVFLGNHHYSIYDGVNFAPPGYEATVTDPKHPSAQFEAFKKLIMGDIGSGIGMGSGKINNDHSAYNFSSAKMDEQVDNVVVEMIQAILGEEVLDPIFEDWLDATADFDPVADEFLRIAMAPERVRHAWLFPQPRSIDELKTAQADDLRLKNGTITRREIYARRRMDADDETARWNEEVASLAHGLNRAGLGWSTSGELSSDTEPDTAPVTVTEATTTEEGTNAEF